jgi:signal transduction histidine kinase
MKEWRIGTKLVFEFTLCIILSAIIGAVAIVNIARIRGNIAEIKICKDIEIEVLECRRQEKNILLLGPYERATLEGEEEKTYLEKINDNLITLKKLVEEGKKRITVAAEEKFNAITIELDNYKIFLKKTEANFKERKSIIENLETNFEELQGLSQVQDSSSEKIAPIIAEVHIQVHHYINYHNSEYINKAKMDIAALKEAVEDKKIISLLDEHTTLINRLIENSKVIETDILSMRKGGRRMQRLALNIIGAVEKKIYAIERTTTVAVWMTLILMALFLGTISIFFVRSITGPIRKLVTATAVIAKGDLSHRIAIESTDEIGELARSFNKMVGDLEKITVLKDYLGSIIGHEFKNQLGVMRNSVYFLKMKLQDADEKIKRHLEILEGEITETNKIIENISTFARTKQLELKELDLKELLLASIEKVKIPENISIATHLDRDLPKIKADEVQLTGVFVNIILNAVEAMGRGGRLTVKALYRDDCINILFEDTGPGIKEEDKRMIFEPFFSTKASSRGLGLATCSVIMEAHGGNINIESEIGKGTKVTVKLPIKKDE